MYELQEFPDKQATTKNGSIIEPIATLKDEHGGISHIVQDDHCYVLYNGSKDRPFNISAWWYKEAIAVLKNLPFPK